MGDLTENEIIISVFHHEDGNELVRCQCGHGSKAETLVLMGDAATIDAAMSAVAFTHHEQVCGLEAADLVTEVRDEWPSVSYFLAESRKDLADPAPKIVDFIGGPAELERMRAALERNLRAVEMGVTCECDPQLRITRTDIAVTYVFGHDADCPELGHHGLVAVDGYVVHD